MAMTPHQTAIFNELLAIANQPQSGEWGDVPNGKCWIWAKTHSGLRKKDWHCLLILADKAMDLGAEVQWRKYHYIGRKRYGFELTTMDNANAVAVYVPPE